MIRALLLALLLVSAPAFADEWRTADTYREGVFLGLMAVDYLQTRQMAKNPDRYRETNLVLGEHPSVAKVGQYFAATSLIQIGVAYVLPVGWRDAFQYVSLGVEAGAIRTNWMIGLHAAW